MRVLLALLACLLPFAAPLGYAQDATTLLAPSKPRVSAAIALADIPGRADTDERYAEEVSLRAARADPLGRLVPRLAAIEQSVAQKNGLFAYGELRTLPVVRLESMERHWKFDARQYARWRADMQASVAPYAQDAAELALRRADWELTRRAMSPDSTPAALSARVEAVAARLQQAEQALSSPWPNRSGWGAGPTCWPHGSKQASAPLRTRSTMPTGACSGWMRRRCGGSKTPARCARA